MTTSERDHQTGMPTGALIFNTTSNQLQIYTDTWVGIGTTTPNSVFEIVQANPILTIRDTDTSVATVNAKLRLAESNPGDAVGNHWDIEYLISADPIYIDFENEIEDCDYDYEFVLQDSDGNDLLLYDDVSM